MSSLEVLLAEREIHRVILSYCRGVDRGDVDLIRACYHPDAVDEHGHFQGNGQEFAAYAVRVLGETYRSTSHNVSNCLIDLQGTVAFAETYCVAHHLLAEPEPALYVFGLRYVDRFEDRGSGWRISHRVVVRDWSLHQPIAQEDFAAEVAKPFMQGRRGPSDLAYPASMEAWTSAHPLT